MKIEEIKTIVRLMSENDLTEFKVEADSYSLCIKRGNTGAPMIVSAPAPVPVSAAPAAPVAPAAVAAPAAPAVAAAPVVTIDSPLVGTFYRSPSPDAPAFVKVGDRISVDMVIGIIEAMKVMNEIKAEKSGIVKEILVQNAQPVEYGQALIVIE